MKLPRRSGAGLWGRIERSRWTCRFLLRRMLFVKVRSVGGLWYARLGWDGPLIVASSEDELKAARSSIDFTRAIVLSWPGSAELRSSEDGS
jgi:hypothetical protein